MSKPPKSAAARTAQLQAARNNLSVDPIEHPRFVDAYDDLELASESSPIVLLLGVSGAGKSYMSDRLVENRRENPLRPLSQHADGPDVPLRPLVAATVTAPAAHRGPFSVKTLWRRSLTVLQDPCPDAKFHHEHNARALREGVSKRVARLTEPELFEMVCDAAIDRRLELLVIDEACSMLKSDPGRTLADQLDLLRELADLATFNVVLVSTFRIVPHLHCSSELNRRLSQVILHRYLDTSDEPGCEDDYEMFCRVAASLMERVPGWARMRIGKLQCRRLYNGSMGCVGVLSDWYSRALRRSARRARALTWSDFEATAVNGTDRSRMQTEAEFSAAYLKLRGGSQLDCAPSDLPPPPPLPPWNDDPAPRTKRKKTAGRSSTTSRKKPRRRPNRHPVK